MNMNYIKVILSDGSEEWVEAEEVGVFNRRMYLVIAYTAHGGAGSYFPFFRSMNGDMINVQHVVRIVNQEK